MTMEWGELSIEQLLRQVREKQAGAWNELLRRSQPALEKWATLRMGNNAPAGLRPSDVAQEAALRAVQNFAHFQGQSEGEWLAWFKRVFETQAEDMRRHAGRQKRDDSDAVSLDSPEALRQPAVQRTPTQYTLDGEKGRRLLAHMDELPEDQRQALLSELLENVPRRELAARLERSEEAVGSLIQRALRTLKNRMAETEGEAPVLSAKETAVRNAADAALRLYLQKREAGERVDPESFIANHPQCAEELRGLLHWLNQLRAIRSTVQ
jgi:RNA polymerase sigma-70 factor, ECF subfamily